MATYKKVGSGKFETYRSVNTALLTVTGAVIALSMAGTGCKRLSPAALAADVAAAFVVERVVSYAEEAERERTVVNVERQGREPGPGHIWASEDPKDLRTKWVPGRTHPTMPLYAAWQAEHWHAQRVWRFTPDPTDHPLTTERVGQP